MADAERAPALGIVRVVVDGLDQVLEGVVVLPGIEEREAEHRAHLGVPVAVGGVRLEQLDGLVDLARVERGLGLFQQVVQFLGVVVDGHGRNTTMPEQTGEPAPPHATVCK